MATEWEINALTYHPDTRRRYGDLAADRANVFRRDGIQMLGQLDPPVVATLESALLPEYMEKTIAGVIQHLDIDMILKIKTFQDIAKLPEITRVAAIHIGAEPKILDVSVWETTGGDGGREAAQHWHRDVDDWRACKLFVYLTDVGPDNGPHMFIPGSHRADYFEARGMAPDKYFFDGGSSDDVQPVINMLPRIEVTGPAGTIFMENTYGYHKGKPVKVGHRILFQVMYGLMDLERMVPGSKIPKIRAAWG